MSRAVIFTVNYPGDPEIPDDLLDTLVRETTEAINGFGYVAGVEIQS